MKRFLTFALFVASAFAQSAIPPAQPTQIVTNKLWIVPAQPMPQQVPAVQLQVSGVSGLQTSFYWIVSRYQLGNSTPAGPFAITNSPNTLSVSNFVIVSWIPVSDAGVTYDVLKTPTPTMPSGACACAVATNVTGSVNDQSNSTLAYTVATFDPNSVNLTLTNEVQGPNSTAGILRQNGLLLGTLGELVQQSVVTLSSAQILALNATPVTLIPAPGAGKLIVPIVAVFDYKFNTTAYTGANSLRLRYVGGGTNNILNLSLANIVNAAASTVGSSYIGSGTGATPSLVLSLLRSAIANTAVEINSNGAFTLGDGTLTVTTYYVVLSLS